MPNGVDTYTEEEHNKANKNNEVKMEKKKIETPAYWREKEFQPLIEVETIYGNKVEIPSGYKEHWDMMMDMSEFIISKRGRADGLRAIRQLMVTETPVEGKMREDFYKVFAGSYQEPR